MSERGERHIDWTAVSAISNIILSVLTLAGILVSLYFSTINTYSNYRILTDTNDGIWKVKVLNTRTVPVNILVLGLTYRGSNKEYFLLDKNNSKLDKIINWQEIETLVVNEDKINKSLLMAKKQPGDVVQIYATVKTHNGKMKHEKMGQFTVFDEQEKEPKLTLNKVD